MASTYHSIYVHIIFATKRRAPMIAKEWRQDLHRYLSGTLLGLGAKPIIVNGVEDHVHILVGIKPSHSIADLVREAKKASSSWGTLRDGAFGWQIGYPALSVSPAGMEDLVDYIANQEAHHSTMSSIEELIALLTESGIAFDPQYME